MRLRSWLFVCLVAVGAVGATSALAQAGPEKEPLPFEPTEFAAGEVCPFAIRIESVANNATIKVFASGREIITGRLTLRLTNLEADRSIVVNASGPVTATPLEDGMVGVVARGRTLLWFFERDVGGARLILTTGRVVEVFDLETDTIVSHQLRGRETDVCARLA